MAIENMAEYMRNRRATRRNAIINLLGGECTECSSKENLEINHIDRSLKSFTLSGKGLDKKWETVLTEVNKCELLCKECHLEKTRIQYKNKEIKQWNDNKHLPYIHGTTRTYSEQACRCEDCRYSKKLYRDKIIGYSTVVKHSPVADR